MRARVCLIVVLLGLPSIASGQTPEKDQAAKGDQKPLPLEGVWIVESAREAGDPVPHVVGDKVSFRDGKMHVAYKRGGEQEAKYFITKGKTPAHIDIVAEMESESITVLGCFKLTADALYLAMSPPASKRPTSVESQPESNSISMVLRPFKEE